MSDATPQAAVAVAKPQMHAPSARLQRKCGCGGPASSFAGECNECASKKRLGVQTKLQVGAPGDAFEQEADRVAAAIMAGGNATPPGASGCHEFSTLPLHAPMATDSGPGPAELISGGSPLPARARAFFEPRFGRDLGTVRLHTGALAHAYADRLQAHAFTYGSHIWLGRGHGAEPGFLMAHELAHVIQQQQPPPLKSAGSLPLAAAARGVQRLPFWVPLGSAGRMTGSDLHEELLANARAGNSALDTEAPAPNANSGGVGLGLQGSIDLYLGMHKKTPHVMPGLYFAGTRSAVGADVQTTRAVKHRRANAAGIAAGRYRPFVSGRSIEGIDQAPDTIQLGELKPASSEMLTSGARQLGYYQAGLIEAQRLTNEWAALNNKPQWRMNPPSMLPEQAVRLRGRGGDMRYSPGAARDDSILVLADIREKTRGGFTVKVRFNPEQYGLPPILGGLYAQHYGNGLWMYFARPRDLPSALAGVRSARIRGEMAVANAVQDQVVNPLLQAPVQAAPLRRREAAVIRRQPKAKAPPLEDKFNLDDWTRDQARLRNEVNPDKARGDRRSELGALQLFAEAQAADNVVRGVAGAGGSTMPAVRQQLDVVTGTGTARKVHKRDLDQVLHWMRTWTSRPASILGRFRKRFGGVFVKLAGFLSRVGQSGPVQRVKAALQNLFKRMSGGRGGSPLADLAIKGVSFALHQIADLLLPPTFRLVASAIHAGIRKKLAGLFELDLASEAKDLFEGFTKWFKHLEIFGTSIESIGEKIVSVLASIQKIADTIRKVVGYIEDAATIVKWGIRGLQCSGVLSCITIVLEPVKNWAIRRFGDKALKACGVRYLIARGVLPFFASVPAKLANGILGLLKRLVPSGLGPVSEIFDESVADEPLPPAKDIVDDECWSIDLGFSLFDGFRTSKPKIGGDRSGDDGDDAPAPPKPPKPPSANKPPPPARPPAAPPADQDDPTRPPRPWTPDAMRIYLVAGAVRPGSTLYEESTSVHTRLAAAGPEYSLGCIDHFRGAVFFVVDQAYQPRPQPFAVPSVSLTLEVDGREVQKSDDAKPAYVGSGFSLRTRFDPVFDVSLANGDDFQIHATLQDPDSGASLTYRDRVKIRIVPCG